MRELTSEIKEEIKGMLYDFLADECEVDKEELNDETLIEEDLDGDSLLFVEIIQLLKKKYGLNIQLQSVGKYLLKHSSGSVGELLEACCLIYQYEDGIVNIEG